MGSGETKTLKSRNPYGRATIFFLFFFLLQAQESLARIAIYSLDEKIKEADIIVLGEYVKGWGTYILWVDIWRADAALYKILSILFGILALLFLIKIIQRVKGNSAYAYFMFPFFLTAVLSFSFNVYFKKKISDANPKYSFDRYAQYRIKRVFKGHYNRDTLIIDYKKTNRKYEPFVCRPPAYSSKAKESILFANKDMTLFNGYQGQIVLREKTSNASILSFSRIVHAVLAGDNQSLAHELYRAYTSDEINLQLFTSQILLGFMHHLNKKENRALFAAILHKENEDERLKIIAESFLKN